MLFLELEFIILGMKKLKALFIIFFEFFKIGLFTFGGGYAMIAVIERQLVERKKYISHEEFMDLIAIAESTPGPLAINSATYIGYKVVGVLGSVFSTLGVALPSFIIIFVISLFFNQFLEFEYVKYAFSGIQACISFLILTAGIKMFKHLDKNPLTYVIFALTILTLLSINFLALNFSSIFLILIGGTIGLVAFYISKIKREKGGRD